VLPGGLGAAVGARVEQAVGQAVTSALTACPDQALLRTAVRYGRTNPTLFDYGLMTVLSTDILP